LATNEVTKITLQTCNEKNGNSGLSQGIFTCDHRRTAVLGFFIRSSRKTEIKADILREGERRFIGIQGKSIRCR